MSPGGDTSAVLLTFERTAIGPVWDKGLWALWLAPYLAGEAQAAYMVLSKKNTKNYNVLKAAILDHAGLSAARYRQIFRATR